MWTIFVLVTTLQQKSSRLTKPNPNRPSGWLTLCVSVCLHTPLQLCALLNISAASVPMSEPVHQPCGHDSHKLVSIWCIHPYPGDECVSLTAILSQKLEHIMWLYGGCCVSGPAGSSLDREHWFLAAIQLQQTASSRSLTPITDRTAQPVREAVTPALLYNWLQEKTKSKTICNVPWSSVTV